MADRILKDLADLIEAHYVFPELARRIAAELRGQRLSSADPEAVVRSVKPFLRGHDGHLSLIHRPSGSSADGPARPDLNDPELALPRALELARRSL